MAESSRPWHHSPVHIIEPDTMYMVTAGTLYKEHYFRGDDKLLLLQDILFEFTANHGWNLQAWAIFSNHYHIIAKSPDDPKTLKPMLQQMHSKASRLVNRMDNLTGRQVWYNYWDKCLTFENSYYARLNYVINNPVKHGLTLTADQYPYCSASWFKTNADPAFRKKVESYKYDQVKEIDDF